MIRISPHPLAPSPVDTGEGGKKQLLRLPLIRGGWVGSVSGQTSPSPSLVRRGPTLFPPLLPSGGGAGGRGLLILLFALLCAGCGNQMFRQPSFLPLDTPRAAPPANSVPVNPSLAPFDAHPIASPAWGDLEASAAVKSVSSFPSKEPDLPPPNLSDNARNEPAPAAVNAIKNPLPVSAELISAGHDLFINRCVQCHNPGGYGYGPVGAYLVPHPPDLASALVQKNSDGAIFWHITMGQGKMPGFRHWTTPGERWLLVEYVRSLKTAKPGQVSNDTIPAPYPVYGEPGFESGANYGPYHVIPPWPRNVDRSALSSQSQMQISGQSQ